MNDIILQINRKGKFKIRPSQSCSSQCGQEGKLEYSYEVSIEATEKSLCKPDMFVVDNAIIKNYFEQTYEVGRKTCKSCEVVACDAIKYFRAFLDGRKVNFPELDVRKIVVIIIGSEFSFIKGEWTK